MKSAEAESRTNRKKYIETTPHLFPGHCNVENDGNNVLFKKGKKNTTRWTRWIRFFQPAAALSDAEIRAAERAHSGRAEQPLGSGRGPAFYTGVCSNVPGANRCRHLERRRSVYAAYDPDENSARGKGASS